MELYYIAQLGYVRQKRFMRTHDHVDTVMETRRCPKYDMLAIVKRHSLRGWQIYLKGREMPVSSARLYKDMFGGVYDLNKPKATRKEAEEHMRLVARLRGWRDPTSEHLKDLVAEKIVELGKADGFDPYHTDPAKRAVGESWFKDKGIAVNDYQLNLLGKWATGEIEITPRTHPKFCRQLCSVLGISLNVGT